MSTFKRIDYFRMHDSIKQRVHTHYDSIRAVVDSRRDEERPPLRRWATDVYVPNLPMTMTFYGATKMQSLKNADLLLEYFIQGPSTPRRKE